MMPPKFLTNKSLLSYLDYNEKDALFSDKKIFWQEG